MIVQRGKSRDVKAINIEIKEGFLHMGDLYMRVSAEFTKEENIRDFPVRCVRLRDGMSNGLPKDCMVTPVRATCTYDE